jgi:hypothetical protein
MVHQEKIMSKDEWGIVSRTIDYVLSQSIGKKIKENPAIVAIRGEPPKKDKKQKKEPPAEQLRLF